MSQIKTGVQSFGRFLSAMIMPNIGAFIAWGFITALFLMPAVDDAGNIVEGSMGGWLPNAELAKFIGPMITYLLPLLIGYTGGKLVGGDRGAVIGAITTMGVIVGSSIPMFLGAMIAGPLGGLVIRVFDKAVHGKIKTGFEMLVNNFSVGILGMLMAILAFYVIAPVIEVITGVLEAGLKAIVEAHLLPLVSIVVEPAKVLFLNNAINHGVFTPMGTAEVKEMGKSIVFLIETNPGPGLGILLAYMFFGRGTAKQSAYGASIIHFFGGIHEIYFPYVLMKPKLIIAAIAGGMAGVAFNMVTSNGLTAPASPGSVIALLAMSTKGMGIVLTLASIAVAAAVSFFVASILLKMDKSDDDDLASAQADMASMKAESKGQASAASVSVGVVNKIIVACDAGMGSSAMGASVLRGKVEEAGLDIEVTNQAINDLQDGDIIITQAELTPRAKQQLPSAEHMSIGNFMDGGFYDELIAKLKS